MSDEYINEQKELEDYQRQDEDGDVFDKNVSKKITWLPMNFTIQGIYNMKKDGDLDPSPSWQREYVFDKIKASRLIESVLLGVPLPAVYLAEEADGTMSVIDGQQRLSTFFFFLDNTFPVKGKPKEFTEFTLSGLQILEEFNKKTFSGLDKPMQLKIKNTPLHVITIKNDSAEDVKFDIFERLNTGSMKLNEDEIRNSVYRGAYIDLLDELSEDKTFNDLVRKPNFKNRMLYRGMILRFFALSEKTYLNYRPSMKQFCNKELLEHRNISKNKADEYKKRFRKSVDLCLTVFGENSFRRFNPGKSETDCNGSWVASRINMALFDVQMCGFVMYEQNRINGHYDEIREAMLELMCNDKEFIDAIELKTSGREQMNTRFKKWLDTLDVITKGSLPSSRVFPYSVKKQLFDEDPTCKLCGNRIMAIEDAEVDHKDPYSKGGPTTPNNAQIAHRYCNRHKGNSTDIAPKSTKQC
jgi:hypothetical protein